MEGLALADSVGIRGNGRLGGGWRRMLIEHDHRLGQGPPDRPVTERPGHPWIGQDLAMALGGAKIGVIVHDDPLDFNVQGAGG